MTTLETIYENNSSAAISCYKNGLNSIEDSFNNTLHTLQSNINDEFTDVDKRIKYLEKNNAIFKDKYISLLENKGPENITVKSQKESVEGDEVHGLKELVLSLQKRIQKLEEKKPKYHAYSCSFPDLAKIQLNNTTYQLDTKLPINLPKNTVFIRLKVTAHLGNTNSSNGHLYARLFLRQTGSENQQGTTDCQYLKHFQAYANLFSHYFTIPWDMNGIQRLNIYIDNCMCDGYYNSQGNCNYFEVALLGAFSF